MTESEKAVSELCFALRRIDYQRAIRAIVALQETRTIGRLRAEKLSIALGTLRHVIDAFPKTHLRQLTKPDSYFGWSRDM
jgi:hypothetical protein